MTPGARIAAAIEVLGDLEARRRPVSEALRDWGLSHRFAGSGDRAAIGNIVYDAFRRRRSLAAIMGEDTPRALALGVMAAMWGKSVERIAAMLDAPHAPDALTPAEEARLASPVSAGAADAVRADIPDWLAPSLTEAFGDHWVEEAAALATRPPLDIRVNRLKADRERVARSLGKYGVQPTRWAPDGLRVPPTEEGGRHPGLQAEPAFQKGWIEIQDEGSQLAALMVGAEPGEQILDLCAGGGGKTLALAAMMANKGQIHATDADKHRLAPIFDRLKRAGTRDVQVHPAGSDLGALEGKMDRVLIDAPCSGSGTWRRHPETKWRLSAHALEERIAEQAALLQSAIRFVKPGGMLAYVTCSVLPQENDAQVSAFVADESFTAVPIREVTTAAGIAFPDVDQLSTANGIQLSPLRTGTDGFYVSVLRRNST